MNRDELSEKIRVLTNDFNSDYTIEDVMRDLVGNRFYL